jgi:hypothetical protein
LTGKGITLELFSMQRRIVEILEQEIQLLAHLLRT